MADNPNPTTDGGPTIEVVETQDVEEAIRERRAQPVPAALPVLPLKDMVTYPDTLTPLAVGRPRSMRLVNDVLSGERMLVLIAGALFDLLIPAIWVLAIGANATAVHRIVHTWRATRGGVLR